MVLSALWFGAYFFLLDVLVFISGGVSEREEWRLFCLAWLTVPPLSLAAAWLLERLRQAFFRNQLLFYPGFFLTASLFWATLVLMLRRLDTFSADVWFPNPFWESPLSSTILAGAAVAFPVISAALLMLVRPLEQWLAARRQAAANCAYAAGVLLIGLSFAHCSGLIHAPLHVWGALTVAAAIGLGFMLRTNCSVSPKAARALDAVAVVAIVALVYNPDPGFASRYHQNFFLGPVNSLMAGKSMLVDVICQYGVGVIYFLKAMFMVFPFSYHGFTLLVMVLYMGEYMIVYWLLRRLLRSPVVAAAVLLLIIAVNFFGPEGGMPGTPSAGPLRFGLSFLLVAATAARLAWPGLKAWGRLAEYLVLGAASVWSLESFLMCLCAFGCVIGYETLLEGSVRRGLRHFIKHFSIAIVFMAAAHGILAAITYVQSGQLPHWQYYMDSINLYSVQLMSCIAINPWAPWTILVTITFASLMALVMGAKDRTLVPVAGLTGLAVAQFIYFIGRSIWANLMHVSIGPIMLAAFWMDYLIRRREKCPPGFLRPFVFCCCFTALATLWAVAPRTMEKVSATMRSYQNLPQARDRWLRQREPTNPAVAETLYLLKRYAEGKKRVAVFIGKEDVPEVLMLSGRAHLYPISNPEQDYDPLPSAKRIMAFDAKLKEGDTIFVSPDCPREFMPIIAGLQSKFQFYSLEQTKHQIFAILLGPKEN